MSQSLWQIVAIETGKEIEPFLKEPCAILRCGGRRVIAGTHISEDYIRLFTYLRKAYNRCCRDVLEIITERHTET